MEESKQYPRTISYGGRTMTVSEWACDLGLSFNTLYVRLRRSGIEKALTMKKQPRREYVGEWRHRKTEKEAA